MIRIVAGNAEIGRRGFDREPQALPPRVAHHFQALLAGKMHHIKVCAGNFRQIKRSLNRKCLGIGRMCELPIGERSVLLLLQFLARLVDQGAGFAMDTRDSIRAERSNHTETRQQHVVGYRFHNPRHARHIEFERSDAVFGRISRNFADLLVGENLRVENRVDVA